MSNQEPLRLAEGEYRFACLVWDHEPLPSGQLVALAAEARRRGMSYGQLMAVTTLYDRQKIVDRYKPRKR